MTIDDLKETAALARLNLDENELAAALPVFEQMLEYFAVMEAAGGDRAAFPEGLVSPPTVQARLSGATEPAAPLKNNACSGPDEALLRNAGEREGRFFVIPRVL